MLLLIKGFSVLEAHAGRPAESVIDTESSAKVYKQAFLWGKKIRSEFQHKL